MSSTVADLIIRIKNGYLARREWIDSPFSRFREEIVKKLKQLGYVADYKVLSSKESPLKTIQISLAYSSKRVSFTDVKIVSTPGRRVYVGVDEIKAVKGGLGHSFISTPKGVKSNVEARKENTGGELLFYIW